MRVSIIIGLVVSLGCSHDSTGLKSQDTAFWEVRLNHHAITMALTTSYSTVQLNVSAYTPTGAPFTTTGTVVYHASDTSVTVSPTGLITARYATAPGQTDTVTATLTEGNVTLQDIVVIKVTPTAPSSRLATFSIQLAQGDSNRIGAAATSFKDLVVTATDNAGDTISDATSDTLLISFTTSNAGIATIDQLSGTLNALIPGQVTFYASAFIYGVEQHDSLLFVVVEPYFVPIYTNPYTPVGSLTPVLIFGPPTVTVSQGAVIEWVNFSETQRIDVIFDNPGDIEPACGFFIGCEYEPATGGGNIEAFAFDPILDAGLGVGARSRKFSKPGTYFYHSVINGTKGKIIVK